MSIALAILFVASLAAGTNATGLEGRVSLVDLKSLEGFLIQYSPYGEAHGNLALLKYELDYARPAARRAGELLVALSAVEGCNEDAMSKLVQISAFRDNFKDYGKMCRGIVQVISDKLSKSCAKLIDQLAAQKNAELASDGNVAKLFEVLAKVHAINGYQELTHPSEFVLRASFLKKFVEKDSAPIAGNRANFDQFFEAHLVEPCKKITAAYGDLYKQTAALANYKANKNISLPSREKTKVSVAFQDILWAFDSCGEFLSVSEKKKTSLFEKM